MATNTRQPDALRELFAALRNDSFLIAERLARQVLAQREHSDHIAQVPLRISRAGNFPKNFASAVRAWEQFLYSLN